MENKFAEAIALLKSSSDYKVLKRLEEGRVYHHGTCDGEKMGVYVDVETTGLDNSTDEIIEVALVPFSYTRDGQILRTYDPVNMLQEPQKGDIPEEITALTGITNEDVAGQHIDWGLIREHLARAVLVIAHNAGFDRPFLEKAEPMFSTKAWACSCFDIDWRQEGLESSRLEYLGLKFGFFYDGHRAKTDCYAGIQILTEVLPKSGKTAMATLLERARKATHRVWAVNTDFYLKDHLKKRGYRWEDGSSGTPRSWWIDCPEEALDEELSWLKNEIYQSDSGEPIVKKIDAFLRYSNRI